MNNFELSRHFILQSAFGIKTVASETVFRLRFDDLPEDRTHKSLRKLNTRLLAKRKLGTTDVDGVPLIPVDLDVSPFDNSGSSKQGVSCTYKMVDGYAPMFAYVGTQGYMLDCELREGRQHCQKGTPEFIRRNVEALSMLGLNNKYYICMDSGFDSADNFDEFDDNYFIVKRNLRKESKEQWLANARRLGVKQETRDGKNVYTGFVDHLHPGGDKNRQCVSVVFEVIERITDYNGQQLLIPELEVNTWWTNLPCRAETIIDLYHKHGTSEQYHSELKSDMDVERLPSNKLCVNKIILLCAMISYNLLRSIGQEVLERRAFAPQKIKVMRWRMKTILQNIIYCAVRLVRHARRIEFHYGKRCPWFEVINYIAKSYG